MQALLRKPHKFFGMTSHYHVHLSLTGQHLHVQLSLIHTDLRVTLLQSYTYDCTIFTEINVIFNYIMVALNVRTPIPMKYIPF